MKSPLKLVTINTHRGLFRYNKLPVGMASCMESLFQRYRGVSVYLDDILVTGSIAKSHLAML